MKDWFEWNGFRCTEYGMYVLGHPTIISPKERASHVTIPGRSGSLTLLEGAAVYDDITLSVDCMIRSPYVRDYGLSESRISRICNWLRGPGIVTFAHRPEGFYRGRVDNQISFEKILRGNPHMRFSVQFRCHPFFFLDDGMQPFLAAPGTRTVYNPGTLPAEPLWKITGGAGAGTVSIGGKTLRISSLTGVEYILVDSEAKIAYTGTRGSATNPLTLLNSRVSGGWLQIPSGYSEMTVAGSITSVEITPRWKSVA